MTDVQKALYTSTVRRLERIGAKDPTAQIIALAEEIEHYRDQIKRHEDALTRERMTGGQPMNKQIEELAKLLCIVMEGDRGYCSLIGCPPCLLKRKAQRLYNAGYRKQSEGEWIQSDIPQEKYVCSVCGGACWYYDYQGEVAKSRFCPNCGAKMRKEDEGK